MIGNGASGDPALPKRQKDLADLTGPREAMFKAEALRGVPLTSFGFGTPARLVGEAATVAYAAAGAIALLSLAGLVHATLAPPGERRPPRRA